MPTNSAVFLALTVTHTHLDLEQEGCELPAAGCVVRWPWPGPGSSAEKRLLGAERGFQPLLKAFTLDFILSLALAFFFPHCFGLFSFLHNMC